MMGWISPSHIRLVGVQKANCANHLPPCMLVFYVVQLDYLKLIHDISSIL